MYAADKNLVSRLLQVGADPTEKGAEVGSAQELCASLADSSTEVGRAIEEIKLILQQLTFLEPILEPPIVQAP